MKTRLQSFPLRSSPWLIMTIAGALCCTHLESGADTFGVTAAGSASHAGAAGNDAGAQAGSTTASGGAGGSAAAAGGNGSSVGAAGDGAAGSEVDCVDERGFNGLGCYQCPPLDIVMLENACSSTTCEPFDNAGRLPLLAADKLPDLPMPAAGGSGMAGGGSGAGGGGSGVACSSLAETGTALYVTGSTAVKPFLQQIAQQLALQKVFVVYTSVGSCTGVDAIVNGTLMRTGAAPLPAAATYWDSSSSTGKPCDLPAAGVNADLGISDVFAPSCPGFELANLETLKIRDAHGPIQTMTFAVPSNSKYREISQQAAYLVFGFGRDGQVLDATGQQAIWSDESALLQRSATSGTQAMLAAAIGVPSELWKGKLNKTSDDVASALQAASATQAAADATLGILGADYIDSRNLRAQIRMLAYQDSHQTCAVTPDSSDTAKDKRNVRDGHYPIWGPLHLLYKVNEKGDPQNAVIREPLLDVVGYLSGAKALPNGVNLIDVYAQSGLVPECAMRVARSADGGPVTPARPQNPCECLFEKKATGATDCQACKVQGDCAASQTCSQGYCERP
jgi:ABC-type phosphate transport system substrate-binding protein